MDKAFIAVLSFLMLIYYLTLHIDITHGQDPADSKEKKVIETKKEFWFSILIPFGMWGLFLYKRVLDEVRKFDKRYKELTH